MREEKQEQYEEEVRRGWMDKITVIIFIRLELLVFGDGFFNLPKMVHSGGTKEPRKKKK